MLAQSEENKGVELTGGGGQVEIKYLFSASYGIVRMGA